MGEAEVGKVAPFVKTTNNSMPPAETSGASLWPIDFGFELADTTRILRKTFNMRLEHHGITGPRWRIIAYLMRRDGMKQVDIADEIELDKAAVGRTIERLEVQGLIRREDCDHDGRARRVFLTPKAIELGVKIKEEAELFYRDILAALGPGERTRFSGTLEKVRATMIELHDAERARRSLDDPRSRRRSRDSQ